MGPFPWYFNKKIFVCAKFQKQTQVGQFPLHREEEILSAVIEVSIVLQEYTQAEQL